MDCEQAENVIKPDFDDSGCVQDAMDNGYARGLLDLSDDVLLCILKYCTPHDLKALGYTCKRLGALVLERSLWTVVDARDVCYGRSRAQWLLTHALHEGTKELKLCGLARQAKGCLGYVNKTRKQAEEEAAKRATERGGDGDNNNTSDLADDAGSSDSPRSDSPGPSPPYPLYRQHARLHINAHQLPRMTGSPSWPWEMDSPVDAAPPARPGSCPGPQFTLSPRYMRQLSSTCPHLAGINVDYCILDCRKISINNFPPTLKKLSLRGSKCYNLPLDKSFLFKIHDYLPLLEHLDLSECEWLEPSSLLPLSKITNLDTLLMSECPGMTEFVAYVSLATRYGFRKLRVLDFRGSPVGDSEVSALGWLPQLEELYLSAPKAAPAGPTHEHYRGDPSGVVSDASSWEEEVPYYYMDRHRSASQSPDTSAEDVEDQVQQMRQRFQPSDHISIEVVTRNVFHDQRQPDPPEDREPPPKRKVEDNSTQTENEAGPSKRSKTEESPKEKSEKTRKVNDEPCCSRDGRVSIQITFGFDSAKGVQDKTKQNSDSEATDNSAKVDGDSRVPGFSERVEVFSVNLEGESSAQNGTNEASDEKGKGDKSDDSPSKESMKSDDSDDDGGEDDKKKINAGASTSRDPEGEPPVKKRRQSGDKDGIKEKKRKRRSRDMSTSSSSDEDTPRQPRNEDGQGMVRIVQNQDPIVFQCPVPVNLEPRHRVLYVNLGQQLHAVHRLLTHRRQQNFRNAAERLDFNSLVTDSAIRRFGRADGEDVNVFHIGPNGPQIGGRDTSGRPNRSNLRVLSVTGYRSITNRSLVHLATAAPHLTLVDFSNSGVTEDGVENFRSLRPECEVRYSAFKSEEDNEEMNV